jgi:hypothetical protein
LGHVDHGGSVPKKGGEKRYFGELSGAWALKSKIQSFAIKQSHLTVAFLCLHSRPHPFL